jgi:very-short-patch-repair endonuclease
LLVRFCSVDGCKSKHNAKGYCGRHYVLWIRHGDPLHIPVQVTRLCSIEGCEKKHSAYGYCVHHYDKWTKWGDPLHIPVQVTRLCSIEGCEKKHRGNDFCTFHNDKFRRHGDPLHISDPKEKSRKLSKANKGQIPWNKEKSGVYSNETLKKMSDARMGFQISEEVKKKISKAVTKALSDPIIKKKMSDFQNRPEVLENNRKQLRDRRHDQARPNKSELQVAEILTENKIKFKMLQNVEYHNNEREIRKKEIDFLIKPKKIIEYNGYYHFDNRKFKPNDVVIIHDKSTVVKNVWKQEEAVLNCIKKEGYKILIIWDMDLQKNIDSTRKKILKFAKS